MEIRRVIGEIAGAAVGRSITEIEPKTRRADKVQISNIIHAPQGIRSKEAVNSWNSWQVPCSSALSAHLESKLCARHPEQRTFATPALRA
jgi:hypothetical protein